jgi:hypothetical protein
LIRFDEMAPVLFISRRVAFDNFSSLVIVLFIDIADIDWWARHGRNGAIVL